MAERPIIIVISERNDVVPPDGQFCITADEYLEGNATCCDPNAQVINLCRDVSYASKGYYVSLLADARGQEVLPRVQVIAGLNEPYARFRALQEAGVPTIDAAEMVVRNRSLETGAVAAIALEDQPASVFPTPLVNDATGALRVPDADELVETFIYLGKCADARFQQAARAVFREWPAPLLRMQVVLEDGAWKISQVAAASPHELSSEELQALQDELDDYRAIPVRAQPRPTTRASLAVLVDPSNQFSPSSPETIDRLERVAARMNVHIARVNLSDMRRLSEYDALFVRCHTGVTHPAFQFALRAEALGMPVVDATSSTIRCTNKVYMEELLRREGIATPRSQILTQQTPWEQLEQLGLPFVLKLPDGDFSAAVYKITSREDFDRYRAGMFRRSPLLIAQEWLPTSYDWRIGVLGGQVLFAAKYHMAQGHWQIRTVEKGTERYGKVEAIRRQDAPREVAALALRAAALVGDSFYGVDIKEGPNGPVVIEVNDNANLDIGYEDIADGDVIYEDIVNYFLAQVNRAADISTGPEPTLRDMREPIAAPAEARKDYGLFEVAGMELEYPIVDGDLNVKPLVEPAFRILAGRGTSDVDLGAIGFSNEFADHVFELKTQLPLASFNDTEQLLFEGVQRFTAVLRDEFGARLFPTAMHPWFDPMQARLWTRSGLRVYTTYARLFNVRTHGWMNVQASHVNLPFGTEQETVAMHNASALLIPYLPAVAASSPLYDERLQPVADGRMDFLTRIQSRVPESCGQMIPEYIGSFADYRRNILQPMYAAIDRLQDAGAIRYEFFNTRAAILRFSRRALEIRVLDTQECVKMDVAIAAFTKYALQYLTTEILAGRMQLPEHDLLVADFKSCIAEGSQAIVHAPHIGGGNHKEVRDVLRALLYGARAHVPINESRYLDLVEKIIDTGTLSERIRTELEPIAHKSREEFREAVRHIYIQLADCLEANEPWEKRWR